MTDKIKLLYYNIEYLSALVNVLAGQEETAREWKAILQFDH